MRGKSSNNLSDRYLQFFQMKETTAASTALQTFAYDTGMSARGGWIWEVHCIEFDVNVEPAVVASGVISTQSCAVSMLSAQTVLPNVGDYGCLYWARIFRIGNGTQNLHYWRYPAEVQHIFTKPFLYAKPQIYLYYIQSSATATGIGGRVGYLTRKVSGQLLWETVEQFMSGI